MHKSARAFMRVCVCESACVCVSGRIFVVAWVRHDSLNPTDSVSAVCPNAGTAWCSWMHSVMEV